MNPSESRPGPTGYVSEFQAIVAIEILKKQKTIAQACAEYNLNPTEVVDWLYNGLGAYSTLDETPSTLLERFENYLAQLRQRRLVYESRLQRIAAEAPMRKQPMGNNEPQGSPKANRNMHQQGLPTHGQPFQNPPASKSAQPSRSDPQQSVQQQQAAQQFQQHGQDLELQQKQLAAQIQQQQAAWLRYQQQQQGSQLRRQEEQIRQQHLAWQQFQQQQQPQQPEQPQQQQSVQPPQPAETTNHTQTILRLMNLSRQTQAPKDASHPLRAQQSAPSPTVSRATTDPAEHKHAPSEKSVTSPQKQSQTPVQQVPAQPPHGQTTPTPNSALIWQRPVSGARNTNPNITPVGSWVSYLSTSRPSRPLESFEDK